MISEEISNAAKEIVADGSVVAGKATTIMDANYWNAKLNSLIDFIPTLLFGILVWYVGFKLTRVLLNIFKKFTTKNGWDPSVVGFLATLINFLLKFIVILTVIEILGFSTASIITMIGACGLAVGLALQGTLQNFAGGVVILVLKPFRIGDVVEASGHKGVVKEISIFNTKLEKALTNELVIIPNSAISSSTIVNWTAESDRRVDVQFSVAYGEDIEKVRRIVLTLANTDRRLLNEQYSPTVVVTALADSSVNMEFRVWVRPDDYFVVMAEMLEKVYAILNENNISIPFPQLDVMIKK